MSSHKNLDLIELKYPQVKFVAIECNSGQEQKVKRTQVLKRQVLLLELL